MLPSSVPLLNSPKPTTPAIQNLFFNTSPLFRWRPVLCFHRRNPYIIDKPRIPKTPNLTNPIVITPDHVPSRNNDSKPRIIKEKKSFPNDSCGQMLALCGFGYWVQGFRCFPWLALNFHMAHNLSMHPSILQVVQSSANLPMVAKPLLGILSDAFYICGAHRIPYISIGVFLQVLSWGLLALVPVAGEALPALMSCILLSNFGAAITEVAKDALTAEYGQGHKITGLQSYAFMALAAGGILGNLSGGISLLRTGSRTMFLTFTGLLCVQLAISLAASEDSLGLLNQKSMKKPVMESIRQQFSNLLMAVRAKGIYRPLIWVVTSIAMVPILSGSIFCYQIQCLNLDPSIIGLSRVVGQFMLLSAAILYDRFWKRIPMRRLIRTVQILYASSLLLDFVLVKQLNLKVGIPNKVFALCFSGIAEAIAQFKLLPFSVLLAGSSPLGCEGSLTSFFASALCLSSIVSGFWGVGLANLIGITSADYSRLPLGIMLQFVAALVPLAWISHVPMSQSFAEKERKRARSRRTRKTRRVGRVVVFDSVYCYGMTHGYGMM